MDKELQEFWEKCGFEWNERMGLWNDPIKGLISSILPELTLDNLFKYTIPVVKGILSESQMGKLMVDWLQDYLYVGVDPTQSLYKGLCKAFELDGE